MTRSDLFAIAERAGWRRGHSMSDGVRLSVETALRTALTPAVLGRRTLDEAVVALMEEL